MKLRSSADRRRGAILYMALFTLIPLAALTFGLVRIATSFSSENRHRIEDEQALFLAEAGIEEALIALGCGGTGEVGSQAAPVFFGEGLFWVEVERPGNDLLLLRSAAMYESGRAAVEQLVFEDYESNRDTTIFSRRPLELSSNVFVDSFDSNSGTYASQVSGGAGGDGAIVESNGGIRIDSAAEVHGDLHPGNGFGVSQASSADITGSLQPLESPRTIETVTPPVIASQGNRTLTGVVTYAAGDYAFGTLTIDGHPVIKGPARLVVDRLGLRSNSSLTLDTSTGDIEIYVRQELILASNSSLVTTLESAQHLTLYYLAPAGATADLRSNSSFYGLLIAPEATIRVRSNFEVFGSIQAEQVVIDSNARIHYDRALLGLSVGAPVYTKVAWNRTLFPVRQFSINRRDPFQLVGVDRRDLALPAEAHETP